MHVSNLTISWFIFSTSSKKIWPQNGVLFYVVPDHIQYNAIQFSFVMVFCLSLLMKKKIADEPD